MKRAIERELCARIRDAFRNGGQTERYIMYTWAWAWTCFTFWKLKRTYFRSSRNSHFVFHLCVIKNLFPTEKIYLNIFFVFFFFFNNMLCWTPHTTHLITFHFIFQFRPHSQFSLLNGFPCMLFLTNENDFPQFDISNIAFICIFQIYKIRLFALLPQHHYFLSCFFFS